MTASHAGLFSVPTAWKPAQSWRLYRITDLGSMGPPLAHQLFPKANHPRSTKPSACIPFLSSAINYYHVAF